MGEACHSLGLHPVLAAVFPCSHDFIGEFTTSYRELARGQSQFNIYEVSGAPRVGFVLMIEALGHFSEDHRQLCARLGAG
jgi:hypothetical protein